jgi:hypothetical protein
MNQIEMEPNMPDHIQRVVVEYNELINKVNPLNSFITSSEIFPTLPVAEQSRMKRQFKLMVDYAIVLAERINAVVHSDSTPAPLTFGEQLVGLSFNPAGDVNVHRAKEICAELADMLENENRKSNLGAMPLTDLLYKHALGKVLDAQMNVVKVLTIKK